MTTSPPEAPKQGNPSQGNQNAKVASAKVVKYVGTADIREIDKAGWANADVNDQNKVVWNRKNNWSVSVADLSDDAVAYCDEQDDGFVVVDANAK